MLHKTIFKYGLYWNGYTREQVSLFLPKGASILTVALQDGELTLWALVDPSAEIAEYRLLIVGTGGNFLEEDFANIVRYIGSVIGYRGHYVLHVFDLGEKSDV